MKFKFFLSSIIVLSYASIVNAQEKKDPSPHSVTYKINYLSPIVGFFNNQLEVGLTPRISVNVFGGFNYRDINFLDVTLNGWLVGVECRIYTKSKEHTGLYFAPYAANRNYIFSIKNDPETLTLRSYGVGGICGYQFHIGNSPFVMDVFGGIETSYYYFKESNEGLPPIGGSLRLGTTFGYRF